MWAIPHPKYRKCVPFPLPIYFYSLPKLSPKFATGLLSRREFGIVDGLLIFLQFFVPLVRAEALILCISRIFICYKGCCAFSLLWIPDSILPQFTYPALPYLLATVTTSSTLPIIYQETMLRYELN